MQGLRTMLAPCNLFIPSRKLAKAPFDLLPIHPEILGLEAFVPFITSASASPFVASASARTAPFRLAGPY